MTEKVCLNCGSKKLVLADSLLGNTRFYCEDCFYLNSTRPASQEEIFFIKQNNSDKSGETKCVQVSQNSWNYFTKKRKNRKVKFDKWLKKVKEGEKK